MAEPLLIAVWIGGHRCEDLRKVNLSGETRPLNASPGSPGSGGSEELFLVHNRDAVKSEEKSRRTAPAEGRE